ncbi:hypothetical protein PQQ96_33375, partial [Paraburkholderia sediminicola]|uniref:hypothetical protein n=1 Tax=Paraburkholderia sediminicola TaxID=458836 RepID=UPI0038BCF62F
FTQKQQRGVNQQFIGQIGWLPKMRKNSNPSSGTKTTFAHSLTPAELLSADVPFGILNQLAPHLNERNKILHWALEAQGRQCKFVS